jgi:hypothetical protein
MKKLIVLFYLLPFIFSLDAQTKTNYKLYLPDKLISDLNFMVETVKDVHPDIYTKIDSNSFLLEKKKIQNSLTHPFNRLDYFKIISPLIAKIGDAHTLVVLPWDDWEQYTTNNGRYFPFRVVYDDGIRVIESADSSNTLEIGTRLLKVNGCSCDSLYNVFKIYRSGERQEYQDFFAWYYFKYYLWLNQINPPYNIEIMTDKGTKTILSKGIDISSVKKVKSYFYNFKFLPEGIGYLDFRVMRDDPEETFDDFLVTVFIQLKQKHSKGLIVDLRNNAGGNTSLGDDLLDYITTTPYQQMAKKFWKSSPQYRDQMRSNIPWTLRWMSYPPVIWIAQLFTRYADMFATGDGRSIEFQSGLTYPGTNSLRFQGKVCFLTGIVTFSSGVDLACAVKDYNIAKIFGEETGGVPNSFGEGYSFNLPNTNMNISVSSARFVRANGDEKVTGGIKPDVEIKTTINDRKIGKDPVMEKAIEYILK